jgi:hypothetical protein
MHGYAATREAAREVRSGAAAINISYCFYEDNKIARVNGFLPR